MQHVNIESWMHACVAEGDKARGFGPGLNEAGTTLGRWVMSSRDTMGSGHCFSAVAVAALELLQGLLWCSLPRKLP